MRNINLFTFKFYNPELEEEFYNFFNKYNLTSLFTNDYRAPGIVVSLPDAQSVVKTSGKFYVQNGLRVETGGSYHELLKKFSDYLIIAQDNKSYEEAIFKIIYNARTFQKLINNIKKVMSFIDSEIDNEHKFNAWNIVFYTKSVY